jgi:hypothetical protein
MFTTTTINVTAVVIVGHYPARTVFPVILTSSSRQLIFDLAKEHGLTRAVGLDVSPVAVAEMQAKQAR